MTVVFAGRVDQTTRIMPLRPQARQPFSYGFLYPQIFPFMKRPDDKVQAGTVAWRKEKALGWLKMLDESLIGPRNAFLCGDDITIADYLGSMMVLAATSSIASLAHIRISVAGSAT